MASSIDSARVAGKSSSLRTDTLSRDIGHTEQVALARHPVLADTSPKNGDVPDPLYHNIYLHTKHMSSHIHQ